MAIDHFEEVAPGISDYFILDNNYPNLKNESFVMSQKDKEIIIKNNYKKLGSYKAVFLHYLSDSSAKIVLKAPKNALFVWFAWGGDFYDLPQFKEFLYSKATHKLLREQQNKLKNLLSRNRTANLFYRILVKNDLPAYYYILRAIKLMDYCAPVIREDYDIIRQTIDINAKYLPFSYGSIKDFIPDFGKNDIVNGKNILLGNSASPNNNHIDILQSLKKLDIKNTVFCPLGYGDENYKQKIVQKGNNLLEDRFQPITSTLELCEFTKILQSCSIVIMNHKRQQAMGTIIASIWYGSKVFFNKHNPIYRFLKNNDIKVFSIEEEFHNELSEIDSSLNIKTIMKNRTNLKKLYSQEAITKKLNLLIETILAA